MVNCSILNSQFYIRSVRWAFERLYREFAWAYDAVAWVVSFGHWRAWALAVQPALRGRVLELGCGTGNLQQALAASRTQPAAIGIDRSPQMLRHTRRRLRRSGLQALLVQADATQLPILPATIDTIVATFPSEYIAAPATLAEARRTLSGTGRLVIILGAELASSSYYQQAVNLAYRVTLQPPPGNEHPFAARLLEGLARAGFDAHAGWQAAPGGMIFVILAGIAEC